MKGGIKCPQDGPDLLSGAWKVPSAPSLSPCTGCAGWGWRGDTGYLGTAWHSHIPVLRTLKTQTTTSSWWNLCEKCGGVSQVSLNGVVEPRSFGKVLEGCLVFQGVLQLEVITWEGGREGRRLHCSAASVTFEFWAPWWLWQHRDCWRRAGAAGRTVHYCYTKALLLQLTRSTVVTKGAFLLTNSSKKRSQIAWLVWWEANQLPG